MSKELVISSSRHETRVAMIEDDQLVEVYHQRENEYSLAGSIHKGRVTRVLPGMQSAFVDIGLERDAFLYVSDFFEDNEEYDKIVTSVEDKVLKLDRTPPPQVTPPFLVPTPASAAAAAEAPEPAAGGPAATGGTETDAPANGPSEETGSTIGEAAFPGGAAAGTEETAAASHSPAPSAAPLHHHAAAPGHFGDQPRRDGRDNRDSRDDRDRRGGRRSRRRRGGQRGGGRGLPDSKFYSPGGGRPPMGGRPSEAPPAPVEESVAPAPSAPPVRESQPEDFFVLPGESLAKYTHPGSEDEEAPAAALSDEEAENGTEALAALETAQALEAVEAEEELEAEAAGEVEEGLEAAVEATLVERAIEEAIETEAAQAAEAEQAAPVAEPEAATPAVPETVCEPAEPEEAPSELAEAVEEAAQEAAEEAAEGESEAETAAERAETAEDVDVTTTDAAEPLDASEEAAAPAEGTESEEEVAAEGAAPSGEAGEGTEAPESTEAAEGEPAPVDEGPEPARIPTSLTATLREQNPRYLEHRVSRRMRRKGGRPEGRPDGRPQEGQGRPDARQQEPRGEQQRTVSAPRSAPEARTERPAPSISDLLREGQEIIVQIAKEPLGQKGARITSHIALPGRFLVYMPTVDHIGVSRKIPSDDERLRLKRVLQSNRTGIPGGYIVRTAGEGRSEEELRADMMFLYNMWLDMRQKAERRPAPMLIHHDLNVVERVLRDQLTSAFKSIWVDSEETYENVLRFVQRFQPALVGRVKLYTRANPIFDEFNITAELEKALRPKVWLKSGGHIVINQTEALVAIDINTGKYVGKSNRLEDTIVKTNTDAVKEIVRQIRLRDLGGIIVVDFIDMDERKNRQKVMQALEEAMRADRAPYKILQFNDFGLVAITRKRVKQSLERTLCIPCPYCEGAGYVKSPQTVVGEILQEAQKIARAVEGKDVLLRVNPEVARLLKSNQNSYLQELEEILGRTVIVKSDAQLHQEKFDLA
ncbi:MAG TPA: Rne/Rng family ribonuclease [Bryobacteraceae bacterium]|nr:Rne/Rng family ribonuclease [Bryobacteraceae bacterium]